MGQLFFTGHGCCLYVPSLGQNQPPPPADDDYFRIRGMEEGRRRQPPPDDVSPACWNLFKIFWRCFTSAVSVALVVWLFVACFSFFHSSRRDSVSCLHKETRLLSLNHCHTFTCFRANLSVCFMLCKRATHFSTPSVSNCNKS
ncbi:hypothetical protein BRADI_1g04681v3 [Brachypodium distachyon]|uniref:Uncharacterized protein n=1 Tax=Brachypodium distachyon TaxID=15368 RepID=A0A2K2DI46_BRADI|nr:hypothetical protein BRADI_1g04681v3 [Brachypodium distachyon]